MAATAPGSTAALLDLIRRSNLLPADRLQALPDDDALPPEPSKAATALVQQGFITKFQATQLLIGRHKGFRIGQYVIQDQLGRGGMGAVYRAEHLDLQRKVAIKVLALGKGDGQKLALERFLREARAAAALDHPNIVRIFDVARHGDTPYLVMEFVDGDTLQQSVDRGGPLPPEVAAECVAQTAAGLQHAHERGFVHRDIKPANIIRDRFGAIKILDMGLARSSEERDKLTEQLDEGAVVGTADYISPEQAINSPTVDARADVYSLGATFYTLLTGKVPFEGNTTQKLMQHQLRVAPSLRELSPEVPGELAAVVARMLAKKPADRFQSAADVIAALAPWAATSARVLSGLSHTSLGATASNAALGRQTAASSRRLLAVAPRDSDSARLDATGGNPTGVLSVDDTLRDPVPESPPVPRPKPKSRAPLVAGLSVALVVAVAVGGWLAFGRDKPATAASNTSPAPDAPAPVPAPAPSPRTPDAPKPEPKPEPKAVPPAADRVVFALDAAKLPDFKVAKTGRNKTSGDDRLQAPGVGLVGWKAETQGEWTCGPVAGARAIGVTNLNDVMSAQIGIELERGAGAKLAPGQALRMRVTYRTAGAGSGGIYFQNADDYKVTARVDLPNSNDEWATVDLVTTRGTSPLRCLIDTFGKGAGNTLFVRSVTVAAVGAPGAAVAPAPAVPTVAAPPNPATWSEGATVYALDAAKIPAFRVQKEKGAQAGADADSLPVGVGCQCWKDGAVADFRRDAIDGVPALGVTNLNDEMSGQFFFSLEGDLKLKLEPGKGYRVKVSYRTANDATGNAAVHAVPGYKGLAGAPLSAADGWTTATASFVRPPATDNVEVRLVIDNTSVGEGNTLWVRSVEIVELVSPK